MRKLTPRRGSRPACARGARTTATMLCRMTPDVIWPMVGATLTKDVCRPRVRKDGSERHWLSAYKRLCPPRRSMSKARSSASLPQVRGQWPRSRASSNSQRIVKIRALRWSAVWSRLRSYGTSHYASAMTRDEWSSITDSMRVILCVETLISLCERWKPKKKTAYLQFNSVQVDIAHVYHVKKLDWCKHTMMGMFFAFPGKVRKWMNEWLKLVTWDASGVVGGQISGWLACVKDTINKVDIYGNEDAVSVLYTIGKRLSYVKHRFIYLHV